MSTGPAQRSSSRQDAHGRAPGDESRCELRFTPPPADWAPPDAAGRAMLRVVLAVKKRRDANRKDAA